MKLIWWCYNCILGCDGRIWVSREDIKLLRAALSIQAISCISMLTTQGNIRGSKNIKGVG